MTPRADRAAGSHADSTGPRRAAVTVACRECGERAAVTTRRAYGAFEDAHRTTCDADSVPDDGTIDDLIGLPPY